MPWIDAWTWDKGTPRERADTVRGHLAPCRGDHESLKTLFNLTDNGLKEILAGSDWKPEHRASQISG